MLVCQWLVWLGAVGALILANIRGNHDLAVYGAFGLLFGILMLVATWLLASRANCPLCMMPVLGKKDCAKHNKARTAFGSHRIRVAISILCKNSFICPYCLESTAVKVRDKDGRQARSSRLKI